MIRQTVCLVASRSEGCPAKLWLLRPCMRSRTSGEGNPDQGKAPPADVLRTTLSGMPSVRDPDGRVIVPLKRIKALDLVLQLRVQTQQAGYLPYPRDWPLPTCLECGAEVREWLRSGGGEDPIRLRFFPCGHGVVADRVKTLV